MANSCDPIQCNKEGLECFAAGDPEAAELLLKKAYRNLSTEAGFLVNLGLALMQRGLINQAERAYRLALRSNEQRVRRSAAKNLGFLLLWRGNYQQGWYWHGQRFAGESFETNQWRGDPFNGRTTVWNDVGMGSFFVRYTLPYCSKEKGALCGSRSANPAISRPSRMVSERSCHRRSTILTKGSAHSPDEPDCP